MATQRKNPQLGDAATDALAPSPSPVSLLTSSPMLSTFLVVVAGGLTVWWLTTHVFGGVGGRRKSYAGARESRRIRYEEDDE